MDTAKFIEHIVVDLLKKDISSEKYYGLGGSKNILRQCVERNNGIGKKVVITLSNLIIISDEIRKKLAIDFLKQFLTQDELIYSNKNSQDIKTIVGFAAAKFSKKNREKILAKSNKNEFKIVDIDELISLDWTLEKIVETGMKLDFETIDDITIEHNGDFEQWLSVAKSNADTIRYLLNTMNEMIGYWHFTILSNETFIKARNGQLLDSEITCDKIPLMLPGTYNIYFIAICLQDKYRRKTMTFGKLLFSIIETIELMAKNKVFINEICALAYTKAGVQLCKSIGLKYLRDHVEHGEIYVGKIMDILNKDFCRDFIELKNIYKNK
jgi:hypothetical protein